MSLHIIKKDITKMEVDAIVNSTNHHMIGYSSVDELLHKIDREAFEEECAALRDKCVPGEAVHTNAYNLPCKYVIHTIDPGWFDGINGEAVLKETAGDHGELLLLPDKNAERIMGYVDAMKLESSMTLFHRADPNCKLFTEVLDEYFDGEEDWKTLAILSLAK